MHYCTALPAFLPQLARTTESARAVGEDAGHLYKVKDLGFKPVIAFKDAQEQAHSGYAGQLQQAYIKGVVEPIGAWHKEVGAVRAVCAHRPHLACCLSSFHILRIYVLIMV